jgi:hypothetical protein
MKTPHIVSGAGACSALVLAASLWAQTPNSESTDTRRQRWEHLAIEQKGTTITSDRELARKINQIGDQGWELVDVESMSDGDDGEKVIFFFKRPKQ